MTLQPQEPPPSIPTLEWYRAVLHASPVPTWINSDGKIIYANQACLELLGAASEAEVVGKTPYDFVHPDFHHIVRDRIRTALKDGRKVPVTAEKIVRLDSSIADVEVTAWPVPFGGAGTLQVTLVDVTEQKRMQQQLSQTEARFRRLIESSPFGILIGDLAGGLEYCNPALLDMLGFTEEDAAAGRLRWDELTPSEFAASDAAAVQAIRANGYCAPYEKAFVDRTGHRVPILMSGARLTDSADSHIAGYMIDLRPLHKAEEAIRDSERMLRAVLDNAPLPMGVVELPDDDSDVLHIYDNLATSKFFGLPTATTRGHWAMRELLVTSAVIQTWILHYRQSQRSSEAARFTYRHQDGRWLDVAVWYLGSGTSGRARFCYLCEDITLRKAAVDELQNSERRFRATIENAAVGFAQVDLQGHWLMVNQRLCDILAYSREELLATTFQDITHPDDLGSDLRLVEAVRQGLRDTYTLEKRYIRKDGAPVWVNLTVSGVRDTSGKLEYFVSIVEDIEARKRAERALVSTQQQFQTLANGISQLVWMARADGWIYWYNQRWYDYTGKTPEEMEGWGWKSVHDPEELPKVLERWRGSIATGEPLNMVFPLRGADGVFRPFLTRSEAARDESGRVTGWFGTNTDISEQRQTERTLRALNEELKEFAYIVSHDMQEPLRMVKLYTELLLKRGQISESRDAQQSAEFIRRGVTRMQALLKDLLTYITIAEEGKEARAGRVALSAVLADVLAIYARALEETSAVVDVRSELPEVPGNAPHFSHVLQNLISNAIKYRKPDEPLHLEITSERQGRYWLIAFRDNGIGFEPRYAEQIFGLFKRLHTGDYPGSGLGLAIARRIASAHGGRIWAESEPGAGASFYLLLPE
jgi:PAS domain S-box-containing protein